jgi:hypothetical protein
MILYTFYKLPRKKLNLLGRMRMIRRSDKHARAYQKLRQMRNLRWIEQKKH